MLQGIIIVIITVHPEWDMIMWTRLNQSSVFRVCPSSDLYSCTKCRGNPPNCWPENRYVYQWRWGLWSSFFLYIYNFFYNTSINLQVAIHQISALEGSWQWLYSRWCPSWHQPLKPVQMSAWGSLCHTWSSPLGNCPLPFVQKYNLCSCLTEHLVVH